jgi:hypothetical protein
MIHTCLKSTPAIWFAGAAILIGAAGCGSHDSGTGGALSDCEQKLENYAASVVLKRDHDLGRAGKPAAVAMHFKGDKPSTYLEQDGKLLLLADVTNRQTEIDYEDWMATFAADARSSVGDEMFAARMKARDVSTCKRKTQ